MNYKIYNTLVAALLGLVMGSTAQAACSVTDSAALPFLAGPPNPVNGFAEYVKDSNGLALELCLDPTGFCFFDPVQAGNAFSEQIGFGFEGFWWLAAPDTTNFPATMRAVLVLGAEAAFLGDIVDGGQFPFTRLRVRLDLPVIGHYRVTEPYGTHVYDIQTLVAGDEVFDSFDVEFTPGSIDAAGGVTEATSTNNCVAPWLTWDTFDPATGALPDAPGGAVTGFIGDGATPHQITGSPTGTNLFRIEAFADSELTIPLNTFDPNDADGNLSLNSVETNLFVVNGKLYDGRLATPMAAGRTTYSRDATGATGQVDVFSAGAGTAQVSATGGANVGGPFVLATDLAGSFFESRLLSPDALTLPPVVELDATDGGAAIPTDPSHLVNPLVDLVSITLAEYDLGATTLGFGMPTLTVEATSSDNQNPPVLRLVELDQDLTAGSVVVTETSAGAPITPPGSVTVSSSAGGSATRLVEVINSDVDGDGIANDVDNCPLIANADQADADSDGIGDVCDTCPADPDNDIDADGVCGDVDNCPVITNSGQEDVGDSDGVGDACDNCITVANGTLLPVGKSELSQRNTDADGFGNMCDADLNNSGGTVNLSDYSLFRSAFGKPVVPNTLTDHADFNGDGAVNLSDYSLFRSAFGKLPGPSAFAP